MTIALLDGFPHAIAIGPTTILPQQWLPKVWGMDSFMPPMASIEQVNHVMGLIMCFYNSIVAGFQTDPPDVTPVWTTHAYWLPYRQAVHERAMAKAMQPKVGRNEPCLCGSGKKFKKCCGMAANLH